MVFFASSPLDVERTARIKRAGFIAYMDFAAANPSPAFAPVIMMVRPVRSFIDNGSVHRRAYAVETSKESMATGGINVNFAPSRGRSIYIVVDAVI